MKQTSLDRCSSLKLYMKELVAERRKAHKSVNPTDRFSYDML